MQHFSQLSELLRLEREEDLREYIRQIRERPLSERVEQGYCWYPLRVIQTGFALGDRAFVLVERTTRLHEPHQLRSGQMVNLFTTQEHVKQPEQTGIINFIERNRMKIILHAQDVPDWLGFGLLGVEMLFDDRSYQEMERALQKAVKAKGNRLAELRDVLTGERQPSEGWHSPDNIPQAPETEPDPANLLNPAQKLAIHHILSAPEVAIIHGPPGTGKTTTLVAAIKQLVARESTVLVTAPSNTAADLLTERLADAGVGVIRIGNISRVEDHILQHTLDAVLARHPESKNIKKVKIQAAEYRRQAKRFKRTFDAEDRRERDHLWTQARDLEAWANDLETRLLEQILTGAQAITCTLVGAAHPVLERYTFRTCVIDEAAQALEPACWIPISKCSRVIFAGDPFQLPPTVKNIEAARKGLSKTMMERCIRLMPQQVHLLNVQYRMHQAIMGFSNQYFYGGALEAHASVGERRLWSLDAAGETVTFFEPVAFVDTAGCGFEERANRQNGKDANRYQSRYNPEEALLVREHLMKLIPLFPGEVKPSIGILSPYREQVNHLDELLREDADLQALLLTKNADAAYSAITINTIDGFQGQERDIIYISLVRSNTKNEIGFLSDYRRMNVAMTRARMLLVVIGDSGTIGNNPFYQAFLEYCEQKGKYQTAWEYMR
jgi:superfamily I DNA and/or RNA helicase